MQIGFIGGGDSYRKIKNVLEPLRWEGKCGIHRSCPKESSCVKVFLSYNCFFYSDFYKGQDPYNFFSIDGVFNYLFIFVICFPLHFITKIRVGFYCLYCFFYSDFYKRLDPCNVSLLRTFLFRVNSR